MCFIVIHTCYPLSISYGHKFKTHQFNYLLTIFSYKLHNIRRRAFYILVVMNRVQSIRLSKQLKNILS